MKRVLCRFPDPRNLERLVCDGGDADFELPLDDPSAASAPLQEGEWVVAVVEVGPQGRATSAAARVTFAPDGPKLVFEPRDWATLGKFARWEARRSVPPPPKEGRGGASSKRSRAAEVEAGKGARDARDARDAKDAKDAKAAKGAGEVGAEGAAGAAGADDPDAGAKILIVDDDPDIREVLTAMLTTVGLSPSPVGSAEEALERVGEERVDLVILDWSLPLMTGLDLCRMLRGRAAFEGMPILFLSANALAQDIDEAFASGADDYVVKPFRAPELSARIWSLLRRAELSASPR